MDLRSSSITVQRFFTAGSFRYMACEWIELLRPDGWGLGALPKSLFIYRPQQLLGMAIHKLAHKAEPK
jgi:hypothetical protein